MKLPVRRGRRPRGIALVAVLWMTAALAILVSSLVFGVRVDTRLAAGNLDALRATAILDGALRLAAAEIAATPELPPTPIRLRYAVAGVEVDVDVTRASGFIHLNSAPESLLADLFRHAGGLPEQESARLAERIVRWRSSPQDEYRSREEPAAASADGFTYPPRHEPLLRPEDAGQIPGLPRDVYDSIRDLVTTAGSGGDGSVNPFVAPPNVLHVLADGDAALVQRVLNLRQDAPGSAPEAASLGLRHAGNETPREFRMRAAVADGRWNRVAWVSLDAGGPARGGARLPWRWLYAESVSRAPLQTTVD